MEEDNEIRDLERQILQIEGRVLVKIAGLETSIDQIKHVLDSLVTVERFNPVAYIAYGLAAGVLTTALGAILSKVFIT